MTDLATKPFELPRAGSSADVLLDRAVEFVSESGDTRISLRALADALGTSHRMLQYHFATRERLLGAVMLRLRERQLAAGGPTFAPATRAEFLITSWQQSRTPENELLLELMLLLTSPVGESADDELLLSGITEDSNALLVTLGLNEGRTHTQAVSEARLVTAALRGFHHDLFTNEDPAGVDAAVALLVSMLKGLEELPPE